ncbi:MAG: polysaccharide deacetylase family protein [Bacteroidetes bacterium]|nr:polysaccharide deacetylase family protein [Bacteroidota bacterium]
MLLYSTNITARLTYIIEFIGEQLFDEPVMTTSDKEAFLSYDKPKINYSETELSDNEFYIKPVPLLFENDIRKQFIHCFELNYHKAFYQTSGDFAFDVFAASFYLLTRYEEYLVHEKDEYGRYAHANSIAYKENFLHQPLINIWLQQFRISLKQKFPGLFFKKKSFRFIPTYDIDIAYSYLNKGRKRNLASLLRSIASGDFKSVKRRINVLKGEQKDPYDSYEWLDSLHLYCRVKPCYFFLVAKEQKGNDKNISPDNKSLQELIQYHAAGYNIGIHPSWQSNDDEKILKEEIEWLEYIADKKIVCSRQHYIRLTLPETYRRLIKAGIEKDFSMGYGSINGFRASVASVFYWYDLEKNEKTRLQIFPFCFMDANSFYEQKRSAQQAMNELMDYYRTIKKVNGVMSTIWHNHFLGTDPMFAGWKEVYEVFLKEEVYWDG